MVLGDQKNLAFASTLVTGGRGEGIAIRTGMQTEIGKIAGMLGNESEATPLQIKLAEIGKILGFLALGICFAMFAIGVIQNRNLVDMLLLAISTCSCCCSRRNACNCINSFSYGYKKNG